MYEETLSPSEMITVHGEPLEKLPIDLYIPPDALRVFLETFQGPLDLLLYLIKKENIDILDIPILEITRQYMAYVEVMRELQLELAAEYLVMAAMLAEIKSRMLLPRPSVEEGVEVDPRAELIRRLQEYERFKKAASQLDELPRVERDTYVAEAEAPPMELTQEPLSISLPDLLTALKDVMERARLYSSHEIRKEALSIRERMSIILDRARTGEFIEFTQFFTPEEGRMGVVVTLIGLLELIRQGMLELVQAEPFATIYVKIKSENVNGN